MENKGNVQKEKPKYFDKFLDAAIGQPVVVVERNGCMSFGILTEYSGFRLSLVKVKVQGKHTVHVPWIIIERSVVAHVHLDVSDGQAKAAEAA